MTRVLYWNINNFSLPKIFATRPPIAVNEATERLNYILGGIMQPHLPDIFVVVEVYSRIREVGLEGGVLNAGSNAGRAVLRLLQEIRGLFGPHWCVVPPLNLGDGGQREAIAVFFNSQNLQFIGPNLFYDRWMGTGIGQGQPVAPNTFARILNYPAGWAGALLNRTYDFNVPGVPAIPEDQLAGQWEYYRAGTVRPIPSPMLPPLNRIGFPNNYNRPPFYIQFLDLSAMVPRTINLFTIHTSPTTARQALFQLQNVQEITNAPAANEVSVVLGDFNVDSFTAPANAAYNSLANYVMELDPRVGHAGAVVPARKPYCMTHLLPTAAAMPFNNTGVVTDPQHNVYPRFGYMGSSWPVLNDSGAIDNVFTRYGAVAGASANITVVNTVVGQPYNAIPAPLGVTVELTTGLHYPISLQNGVPPSPPNPPGIPAGGINPAVDTINFQAWQNFGGIHSTSDHLPLIIDI